MTLLGSNLGCQVHENDARDCCLLDNLSWTSNQMALEFSFFDILCYIESFHVKLLHFKHVLLKVIDLFFLFALSVARYRSNGL